MTGYTEDELRELITKLTASKMTINNVPLLDGVRHAFRTNPFIYGTQGKGGGGLKWGGDHGGLHQQQGEIQERTTRF